MTPTLTLPGERARRMAARASTFSDRLADAGARPVPAAGEAEDRVARWRSVVSPADAAAFDKRLEWDGWAPETARSLVDDVDLGEGSPAGAWTATLDDIYGADAAALSARFEPDPRGDRALNPAETVAFEELYVPAVRYARARLRAAVPDADELMTGEAHAGLEHALLKRVGGIFQRAMYTSFTAARMRAQARGAGPSLFGTGGRAPDTVYRAFVAEHRAGGLLDFLAAHPVAARLCTVAVTQWVITTGELLERIRADRGEIAAAWGGGSELGPVVKVKCDSGDTHDGGRAVAILTFQSGARAVYKPREVALDALWSRVVAWFNLNCPGGPDLRAAGALLRKGYGWVEFIATEECASQDEVRAFYERSGQILALVYALNGNDFHAENVIAGGPHPVLIDHEALMSPLGMVAPATGERLESFAQLTLDSVQQSVSATGLLPLIREMSGNEVVVDLGGLTSADSPDVQIAVVHWRNVNTDMMKMATIHLPYAPNVNVPRLDGAPAYATACLEEIVAGFTRAYRTVLARRNELLEMVEAMSAEKVRFIPRQTSLYAALLQRCLHPEFLRDGWRRAVEFDVLARPFLEAGERPIGWPMLEAERRSLEQNDIPLFGTTAGSRALQLPSGDEVENFFNASAIEQGRRRLDLLGEANLVQQVEQIRSAFLAAAARGMSPAAPDEPEVQAGPAAPWSAAAAVSEAEGVAAEVEARGQHGPLGLRVWMAIQHLGDASRYAMQPMGPGLFDGYSGVALMHAALARVTGEAEHGERAIDLLQLLMDTSPSGGTKLMPKAKRKDVGAGSGLGSSVYALASVGELMGSEQARETAVRFCRQLADAARGDRESGVPGVMQGISGTVLALLKTHAVTGDAQALADASTFGAGLLDTLRKDHPHVLDGSEREGKPTLVSGLPLGAAGVALAFARLHTATGDAELLAAAEALLAYDERIAAAAVQADGVRTTWAGSCGSAFARMEMPAGSAARAGLDAALADVAAELTDGCDHLAGGAMGRIDLLLSAGVRLGDGALVERARAAAMEVVARGQTRGAYRTAWGSGICHPGLFQGASGVAYQLLRLARPGEVPSVLSWS
jgi:type 2 lantibiotic biosynthesis protein LanM